jgi:phosphoribosylformylglycinamidine cyclo-ligase
MFLTPCGYHKRKTGGNLCRIIPDGLSAKIDLSKIRILNLFKYIRDNGNISDDEMLRTFNCGVGLILVTSQKDKKEVMRHIAQTYDCYEIGSIKKGDTKVAFEKKLNWV